MDKLAQASKDDLLAINEIGDKMADSIVAYFEKEEAVELINELAVPVSIWNIRVHDLLLLMSPTLFLQVRQWFSLESLNNYPEMKLRIKSKRLAEMWQAVSAKDTSCHCW